MQNRQKASANVLREDDVRTIVLNGKSVVWIRIPRAGRRERPVFINGNPLRCTYKRHGEGDFRCDEELVKRMLAEQVEDARDARLLENFDFNDIHAATLNHYRNAFRTVKPGHPWIDLDDADFLRNIGGWARNRDSGRAGLTIAGLLMFGSLPSILQAMPHYVVDYREQPGDDDDSKRWLDRLTTDGTWSGNLYDFYRSVFHRLTSDLKVPFLLKGDSRVDETPVHEAIREALVNTLIHADFSGRLPLLVTKRLDGMTLRNPGGLRVPLEQAIAGGMSDCRNWHLQKMLQLVGLGEQAGSGLNRVFRNWAGQHWRAPELIEDTANDVTTLNLRMVSLLPDRTVRELDARFGPRFRELPDVSRLALASIAIEGSVTHSRLMQMTAEHRKDVSARLADLVAEGLIEPQGFGRGTVYFFRSEPGRAQEEMPLYRAPAESAGSAGLASGSEGLPPGSAGLATGSEGLAPGSVPVSDPERATAAGSSRSWAELWALAEPVRTTGKASRVLLEGKIAELCAGDFLTVRQLGALLNRSPEFLLGQYLRGLVADGRLSLLHPEKINHPQQAYRAAAWQEQARNAH